MISAVGGTVANFPAVTSSGKIMSSVYMTYPVSIKSIDGAHQLAGTKQPIRTWLYISTRIYSY